MSDYTKQQDIFKHPAIVCFSEHLEKVERHEEVLSLLGAIKSLIINWAKSRGFSDRAIANWTGVSNTRVGVLRKRHEGGSK